MAGEIEEPFTFDFRVDSFDSGSISFGRFESEGVCWERRSSFLHNRYLEEVEKYCSKPGSVTEKKAYFEAHFRKKGFPVLTSPERPDDKCSRQEPSEIGHMKSSAQSDQSLDGLDNNKLLTERDDHIELGTTLAISSESVIQMNENLDCETDYSDPNEGFSTVPQQTALSKKNSTSKPDHIKPRLVPRVSPGSSRRCTPVITSKAEKKTSSGDPQKHRLLHKTTKYDQGGSETKGVDSAAGREVRSISRSTVEPQKVSGRAMQSANRVKPAVGVPKSGTRQDTFKSTKKEAVPSNIQPGKPHAGTSIPGTRLSKSSQSKVDRFSSTESWDSGASSSARTSKVKASQTRISRKKEPGKEKLTSVRDGKQNMRTESSSYASLSSSSSRGGRVAVGVVS